MHVNTKGRRATAVTAVMAAGTLALGGCGADKSSGPAGSGASRSGTSDTTSAKVNAHPSITAVIRGLEDPFLQMMKRGVDDQARTAGVPVTVQAAESAAGAKGRAAKPKALAERTSSCFVVNPTSGTELIQDLAKISASGRTIVNIDSPVDVVLAGAAKVKLATYIGTDNAEAGRTAGQRMAELLPSGGDVAVIAGDAGDVTSDARIEGFRQGIGTGLKVVQTVGAKWERQTALTAAADVMRAHPDLAGFFVANDDMGLGVARAVANAGKTGRVKVISVDGAKDALKAVKEGSLDGTVAQYPYVMGLMGVEACQADAKGKMLPFEVRAPIRMVTKENAGKALASMPKPFDAYEDPFRDLAK
jgi:ABC-type sugar transport system substrate-binding protein